VVIRDAYVYLWQDPWYGGLWAAEVVLGVLVPLILLASARLRRSLAVLPTACGLAVLGLIMNRMNVFLVSYRPRFATSAYFPSLPESLVTAGLVAAFSLLFLLAIRYLPIWPAEPLAPDTKAHS
jgi:Ni/Fe-hydrogenase subunit HybB-like protein